MKVKINRQTFIKGNLVKPGDVVEVDRSDYYGNLFLKADPVKQAPKAPAVKQPAKAPLTKKTAKKNK